MADKKTCFKCDQDFFPKDLKMLPIGEGNTKVDVCIPCSLKVPCQTCENEFPNHELQVLPLFGKSKGQNASFCKKCSVPHLSITERIHVTLPRRTIIEIQELLDTIRANQVSAKANRSDLLVKSFLHFKNLLDTEEYHNL